MYRVLLLDDELIVRAAFQKIIPWEREGFEIVGTASNGQEALRLIREQRADVVITDLKMPQMDGIALINALKGEGFEGVILVLSNYADFELVREALVAGATDNMLKVNTDARSLIEKLRLAREALASRQRSQQKEQLVAEHSTVVRAHALRAYLTADAAGAPIAQTLEDAYGRGPYALCSITPMSSGQRAASRPPSMQHVEAILRTILEDVRDADILTLDDRTLLCAYPIASLSAKGIRGEGKLDQIARQLAMYFNASALIVTAPPAASLPAMRERFAAMRRVAALSFYALPTTILSADAAAFGALPDSPTPEDAARRLAEAYFMRKEGAIATHVAALMDAARAARAHPADVIAFLQAEARQLLTFAPNHRHGGALLQETADWAASPREQELSALATALFERILTQIIPPGYARCREEIKTALLYLHVHYTSHIALDDVARATNLDRSYLCRLFKRETGANLFTYLNALRMDAAAKLIEQGNTYIRDVSHRVGIADPFYFARLFKKRFHKSPSEYLQSREARSPRNANGL